MIQYFAISYFNKRLQMLLAMRKGIYSGVDKEISKAFSSATMEEIRNNRDMILMEDALVVVKLRLPDKKHQLSKKDGYRLIYMAFQDKEEVVFLDIYPKNGPLQQLNISEAELLALLDSYAEEVEQGVLSQYIL